MSESAPRSAVLYQTLVGVGALLIGFVLAIGAMAIPSEAGYAGVGPNALPWLVSAALIVCGLWLIREALSGGFRQMETPSGAEQADWKSAAWVVAAVVANASLITRIGFVLALEFLAVGIEGRQFGEAGQVGVKNGIHGASNKTEQEGQCAKRACHEKDGMAHG